VLQDGGEGKPMKDSATVTKIQHTPGPWSHNGIAEPYFKGDQDPSDWLPCAVWKKAPDGMDIPICTTNFSVGKYKAEPDVHVKAANARLIAAAPEMLEALKSVSEAYQSMFDVMPVAWQTFDDIVNEAIAKAEGSK
jgi:hypothetical protein